MIENGQVQVESKSNFSEGTITINTTRILFVFAGAFEGIEEIIKERTLQKRTIGFNSTSNNTNENNDIMSLVILDDIHKYGFLNELLGRIGEVLYIPPLNKDDYRKLIKGYDASAEQKYKNMYSVQNVDFSIDDRACNLITEKAMKNNIGSRSVAAILQNCLGESFQMIDDDKTITKVVLTEENGDFKIDYMHSDKEIANIATDETNESVKNKDIKIDISNYLKSENRINEYVLNMMNMSNPTPTLPSDLCLYLFIQTALRALRIIKDNELKTTESILLFSQKCESQHKNKFIKNNLDKFVLVDVINKINKEDISDDVKELYNDVLRFYKAYRAIKIEDDIEERIKEVLIGLQEQKEKNEY